MTPVPRTVRSAGGAGRPCWVVLLRAVNVGGSGTLRTKDLPAKLPQFQVENIGAAGTFVVRGTTDPALLRKAFRVAIGFDTDIIVRSAEELSKMRTLAASTWAEPEPGEKRFVTFLAAKPARPVSVPHAVPDARAWEVRLDAQAGIDVLSSSHVRGDRRRFYANEVVERLVGVPSTTRGWETLERVWQRIEGP
ncbi:MAG: DUF1697 domain-containing protein [Thermoplasmata archaeon]|nr:DUF1697 domain-containing protein [Thermoplasmata archaeon]MCI4356104.1 DUF1697 domain-containing protein [Thermoplasmata archaeon]